MVVESLAWKSVAKDKRLKVLKNQMGLQGY